ncbi:MAG: hypothetical protein OEY94_00405 [Alphaproteobacteria bacterium]|nr:hypothetical protein [Alphaproteobacteria bacterium]
MIEFQTKADGRSFAGLNATQEEWDGIKRIVDTAAKPEVYYGSDYGQCTGGRFSLEQIQLLSERLNSFELYNAPPVTMFRKDVVTLLAICQNITDSRADFSAVNDDKLVKDIEQQMFRIDMDEIFTGPAK